MASVTGTVPVVAPEAPPEEEEEGGADHQQQPAAAAAAAGKRVPAPSIMVVPTEALECPLEEQPDEIAAAEDKQQSEWIPIISDTKEAGAVQEKEDADVKAVREGKEEDGANPMAIEEGDKEEAAEMMLPPSKPEVCCGGPDGDNSDVVDDDREEGHEEAAAAVGSDDSSSCKDAEIAAKEQESALTSTEEKNGETILSENLVEDTEDKNEEEEAEEEEEVVEPVAKNAALPDEGPQKGTDVGCKEKEEGDDPQDNVAVKDSEAAAAPDGLVLPEEAEVLVTSRSEERGALEGEEEDKAAKAAEQEKHLLPEAPTVEAAAQEMEMEGAKEKQLLPEAPTVEDDSSSSSSGEDEEDDEGSCDMSADTVPMMEEEEDEDGEERDSSLVDILSPHTKTVHRALVDGCRSPPRDEQPEKESDTRSSDNIPAVVVDDDDAAARRASKLSVDTDDGMGQELTNLNSYEDETRKEVEIAAVTPSAKPIPCTSRSTTSSKPEQESDGDDECKDGKAVATVETSHPPTSTAGLVEQESGSGSSVGGAAKSSNNTSGSGPLERLQQQVGDMARAMLNVDSDDDDMNFVPLGSEHKRISFMSDDGMGQELSHLKEAEDETHRDVESATVMTTPRPDNGVHTPPDIEDDTPSAATSPVPQSLEATEEEDLPAPISQSLDVVEESNVSPAAPVPALAPAPLISDIKLSFQECIERERWDDVRQLLETDHGKLARQDVYVTNNVNLGEGYDDMDFDDLLDASGDGIDTKYRRKATALHLACSRDPPLDVVKGLIRAYPEAASTPTYLGWEYPLHYAVGSGMSSDAVLEALVEAYPDAVARVSTGAARYGCHKSPLHLAVSLFNDNDDEGPSLSVLRTMCRRNPAARKIRDGSGRAPLELVEAHRDCSQDVKKILSPSDDTNELARFRAKALLAAVLVVGAAILLRKLENAVNVFLGRAEATLSVLVSMGSSGLAVAVCICIVALLVVNTTRILQPDKTAQRTSGEDNGQGDELVTILYVSAVGLIVLFATEPVTLLLHTTVVTGCALGYILLRRSRNGPIDNVDAEFVDCRDGGVHRSLSDSSFKEASSRQYDMTPLERDGMCIVCWERPADHVLVPCGHLCLCAECPQRLGDDLNWQCPIGKCSVHAAMKVYPAQIGRDKAEGVDEEAVAATSNDDEES